MKNFFSALLIISIFTLQTTAFAQGDLIGTREEGRGCFTMNAAAQKYQTEVTTIADRIRSNIPAKTSEYRSVVDETLKEKRSEWSTGRQTVYDTLLERATTPERQKAVETFKETMEAAVAMRESSIDIARDAYRKNMDTLLFSHETTLLNWISAFQTAIHNAVTKTEADCNAGAGLSEAQSAFRVNLQAADLTRENGISGISSAREQLKIIIQSRDEAIKKALDAYKASEQIIITALREAFAKD